MYAKYFPGTEQRMRLPPFIRILDSGKMLGKSIPVLETRVTCGSYAVGTFSP